MDITINTNFPPKELRRIVESIAHSNPTGDQYKPPQQRREEIDDLMKRLKGHTTNQPPTEQELQSIYDNGGRIRLKPITGQTIDYQA